MTGTLGLPPTHCRQDAELLGDVCENDNHQKYRTDKLGESEHALFPGNRDQ